MHVICNFVFPGFDLRPDQEDHPEVSAGVFPHGHGHRVTDGHRNGGNCDQIDMCYNIRELGLDIDWLLRLQYRVAVRYVSERGWGRWRGLLSSTYKRSNTDIFCCYKEYRLWTLIGYWGFTVENGDMCWTGGGEHEMGVRVFTE